jgi:3',5'-cyclic AMP phosphodiesterase CpdA
MASERSLLAISDLHVGYAENRAHVERLRPRHEQDWLIVAGDVGELSGDIDWALRTLAGNFAQVVWVPGNHELWTHRLDPVRLRGVERYRFITDLCKEYGILTPEDPYPVWDGPGGPVTIAPLFLLYDYTFRTKTAATKDQALAEAYERGIVCSDEFMLHPDPYPSREAWCRARIQESVARLEACDRDLPFVLVNHYPLVREPTMILRYPEFAQWCGTVRTADWHMRFRTAAVVYGHLHIPRTTWHDGVRFEEVSVGYPREWRGPEPAGPRRILPWSDGDDD